MTATTPKFSVVVPACARPQQLAHCLARLAPGAQTYPAENYEVIVTDDSPDMSVRDLVKNNFPWAQWTAGPRRGPAANRNHGTAQARGEWLAFTDDDCLPEPGWLAAFAEAMDNADAVEGRTYADRPRQSLAERAPVNTHGGFWWSCNFAVRAELFRRLGGFNEGFPFAAMEDVDFAQRMRAGGAREKFAAAAAVCHPWREVGGFRAMWKMEKKHLASVVYYLQLHPEARREHTPWAYLKNDARQLLRDTLPGLWRWRGRGAGAALAWHTHTLLNAWVMAKPTSAQAP